MTLRTDNVERILNFRQGEKFRTNHTFLIEIFTIDSSSLINEILF